MQLLGIYLQKHKILLKIDKIFFCNGFMILFYTFQEI